MTPERALTLVIVGAVAVVVVAFAVRALDGGVC